jgi:hypothetical protein
VTTGLTSPVGSSGDGGSAWSPTANVTNSPTTLVSKKGPAKAALSKKRYITATRLADTKGRLSPVDWETLRDVAALNVLSGNQLRRLHYQDTATGRRMARLNLGRLVQLGVLGRLGRRIGGERAGSEGFIYVMDVAGQRLMRPPAHRSRKPWTPASQHLNHALSVSELYVQLREAESSHPLTLERFDAEPRCWRTFHGPGGPRLTLKPDAYAVTGNDEYVDSWFIELDRATEPMPRLADKCKLYWLYWQSGREQFERDVFPTVLFIVPTDDRQAQLLDLFGRLAAERRQLFRVVTAEQAANAMASGELLSNNNDKEVTS